MQPGEDRLPAEMDEQNAEMVALLRQSYDRAKMIAVEPDPQYKALGLAAVRQRLLAAQQAQSSADQAQASMLHLFPAEQSVQVASALPELEITPYKQRRRRGMSLLAAVLCVAMLVGSMLTVFGLLKRNASTQISSTAGTQVLYVVTTGWLQKIDAASGNEIWRMPLPYQKGSYNIPFNFPLVGNGVVYVTANNTLFAFRASDGHQSWSIKLSDGSLDSGGQFVQPVFADGRLYYVLQQYIGNSNRVQFHIDVFDATSGHLLWRYQPAGYIVGMVVKGDTIYVANVKFDKLTEDDLTALDVGHGSQKWSAKTEASPIPAVSLLNGDSKLVVENGNIYQLLSSGACGGTGTVCLFAWRADTGGLLWHSWNIVPASPTQQEDFFSFDGSLISAGDQLYINSTEGLYSLDSTTGQLLWRQPEGSLMVGEPTNKRLGQSFAGKGNPGNPFVVVGKSVFRMEMTTQGNYLTQLNSAGKVINRQHVEDFYCSLSGEAPAKGSKQGSSFCILEGLMTETTTYVFPAVGRLDALDNRTGKRIWSIQLAARSSAVFIQAS